MIDYLLNVVGRPPCILALGAHSDDIEIGCGGLLMRLAERHPQARIVWVTLSADDEREAETRAAAASLLQGVADLQIHVARFKGSYFPHEGAALKDYVEALKPTRPDLVLTHCRADLHQDHRVVNELTWNTFRDHAVLEYEIPKFDGDLGQPNVYVPMTEAQVRRKCDVLMSCFRSQRSRAWFRPDTFRGLAALRGNECNAREGFAEAFFGRKLVLGF